MTIIDYFLVPLVLVFLLFSPILIALFVWRKSRRMLSDNKRFIIRLFVLSILLTPTVYGHMGILPAFVMMIIGDWSEKFYYGFLPIIVVLLLSTTIALAWRLYKSKA